MTWGLVMFFYYPYSVLKLILSYFLFAFFFLMALFLICLGRRLGKGYVLACLIVLYFSFSNYLYFWTYNGFLWVIHKQRKEVDFSKNITEQFYSTGWYLILFNGPFFALLIFYYFKLNSLGASFLSGYDKELTIKSFSEKLKLQV